MTDGSSVRVGVIGVGHLGRHHARILGTLPGAQLTAAVDVLPERAERAVTGTDAIALSSYAGAFDHVDAVVVAVPTKDHLRVASEFLVRGKHVLVEKPIASTLAEAGEIIAIAERSGACLAVGHTERFNPALQGALRVLERPRFIEIHRLSGFPDRSLDIDVIFDVMIHDLDMLLAVDTSGVTGIEAIGVPVLTSRVDIANARIKFASGCIANLTASRISRDKVRKVRCFQQDMYVSVDYAAQELEVWRLRRQDGGTPVIEGGRVEVVQDEPLRAELADFIEAIRTKRPPLVTGAAGQRALSLATSVAEAIDATGTGSEIPDIR